MGTVVEGLLSAGIRRVRVIDNGSSDRTAMVSIGAGAEVLREPVAGYGRACWLGLQELPEWVEWVLFCDADGSDDLAQLPAFFEAARNADFILGALCSLPGAKSLLTPPQRFGNALATTLIRLGWDYRFRDLGPFRLIRRKSLEDIGLRDRSWGWTIEMQVRSVENKLRIVELPVIALPRRAGKSKISGSITGSIRAGVVILSTLSRLYWHPRL